MGFIQALIDEIIPLPRQSDMLSIENKQIVSVNRLSFSFLNLIFQFIDCVLIPFFTWRCLKGQFNFGWITWVFLVIGGFSSAFSFFQFFYYFFFPAEKYTYPLFGRIIGETAVGGFIAALFKIKIKTYVE
jgi:hypothetical protein